MKVTLLFLTIGCGMPLCSTVHATEDTKPRQKVLQTPPVTNRHESAAKPGHNSLPLPKALTPHRGTNRPKKNPAAGKTINADHHASGPRNNPISASSSGNRNGNQPRLVQPSLAPRPAASTPSIARHRGPNPTIIGGPKNVATADTAALSGRALHRGPRGIPP